MFLGLGKSYYLGIDFGTSLIKAVELTLEKGQPKLVNFGQVDLARLEKGQMSEGRTYDEEVVLYLRALLTKMQPKSSEAAVAMPAFTGLISLVELPQMKEEELKEAIQFEARKYIPSSLDDVALSWEVVGERPSEDQPNNSILEILLVAALNKEVARYRQFVQDTHLKLRFLELETFSLVRSIVGNDPGLFLVVDIGSRATNLVLVDEGLVKVSRNLDVGGRDITRSLMEGLSITAERAESLKKSGKDFLGDPASALVFPTLELIAGEISRMLSGYQARYPDKSCQGIILSGGTAQFTGLTDHYAKIFGLPVSLGNPWRHIRYDDDVAAEVESMGTSFSVAIGLALSGIDALAPRKEFSGKKHFSLKEILNKKL
jgi:type IV pilus assembly protein PilM